MRSSEKKNWEIISTLMCTRPNDIKEWEMSAWMVWCKKANFKAFFGDLWCVHEMFKKE
jgi:hypothetical protein